MNKKLKSQQQHTIPRWLLENFTDQEGMLYVVINNPRKLFKSKPTKVFRRKDYYAAKEVGESLEDKYITKTENLALPCVTSVLHAAQEGMDKADLSCMNTVQDDIRGCGLFLLHLAYRSPQRLGADFFSGLGAIQIELGKTGKDMTSVIQEQSMQLMRAGEFVLVVSQVNSPTFVLGDCGPFVSQDTELGVDNKKQKRNDPNWIPAEQRIWMALSPKVALGVSVREADATLRVDLMPGSNSSADWVDHFNEICARHSSMIAGTSKTWVCAAAQEAWPIN